MYKVTFLLRENKTEGAVSIFHIVMKGKYIAHILTRNCLLKHVPEGKIEETGIRGRSIYAVQQDIQSDF